MIHMIDTDRLWMPVQYFAADSLVIHCWETTELPIVINQLIFYLVLWANCTFVFLTESKNWVCNVYRWFYSISSLVSDSGPASVSGSGSGADSVSGSGSVADSGSGSCLGADSGLDSLVSSSLERRLVLSFDGAYVPSSWGIGEEVMDGDLALFIFAFLSSSRGGLASFRGHLTFFHGHLISCHGDFDSSRKCCLASSKGDHTSFRGDCTSLRGDRTSFIRDHISFRGDRTSFREDHTSFRGDCTSSWGVSLPSGLTSHLCFFSFSCRWVEKLEKMRKILLHL